MRQKKSFKTALLLAASAALAACSEADVASPGSGNPVIIQPIPGGGGGSGGTFATRATAPISAGDCPTGLTFVSNVSLLSTGSSTNFCSLTPLGGGTVTGAVNIPLQADPILISGTVFLGDGGAGTADYTFAPGQVFVSQSQTGQVDLLVVSRGSQIHAVGNQNAPIVFTSMQDMLDDYSGSAMAAANGTSGQGDWGGLAINGRAPLNECTVNPAATPGTDACRQNGEGGSGEFGGGDANDDSGVLQYVRIQHAGFPFTASNELNSIAMQGVGDGTTISYVQIVEGADDGIEWFGGTVNVDHLVVTGANDDSIDWTDGWTGRLQFALVIQSSGDDNGIEGDNNGDTSADATPRSSPRLSNLTLIGDGASGEGIQLRAGTAGAIINAVVTNFEEGLEFNPAGTGPDPVVNSVALEGNTNDFSSSGSTLFSAGADNRLFAGNSLNGVLPGVNEAATPATDPTTVDLGFAPASYVGAFSPSETAANNWTTGWTVRIPGATSNSCPSGTTLASETPASASFPGRSEQRICIVNTPVLGNVDLTIGNLYRLDGTVFVGQDRGSDPMAPIGAQGVLSIAPGVTIFGNQAPGIVDLLVVSRGSQIFANGSPVAPVILTSRLDLENGGNTIRSGVTGEIGGLAINGRAPLNECTIDPAAIPGSVDCEQNGEGGSGGFGGATSDDNSGRINYMQIRYAGFPFTATNELNSIAMQGVGDMTEIDYVQIINGADDGIEWFGGAVDVKHLIVLGANDDSIDWTDGWTGSLQYAIVRQNPGDDNGIEADNNGDTTADATPRSAPTIANFTLIGDGASGEGIQVRAGTAGSIVNGVVTNFAEALEFNPAGIGPDPVINRVAFSGVQAPPTLGVISGSGATLFAAGTNTNTTTNTLTVPTGFVTPLLPGANETSPAIVATNPNAIDPALDVTNYVGAVRDASDVWFAGWTLGM
ncbi:MAG TPA: hypothetical protein PKH09_01285 [Parvularculaceae bacterium]|nr:hypothetical protein [Parvularculaceae bacterium]